MLIEKFFSENSDSISVGVANISSTSGNLEANKKRIVDALDLFSKKDTNIVLFPEYCIAGCFWEHEEDCRSFMEKACLDHLTNWLDEIAASYVNDTLQYIVINGLKKNRETTHKFFNLSIVLDRTGNYFHKDRTYKKTFLPGLEKKYISSGINDTLVLETDWGKLGFLTCYDICFPKIVQELVYNKKVDAIVVNAAWRKQGKREYKGLKIKEEAYYKVLWDMFLPSLAFQNQVWVMAANAVGPHSLDGLDYCGGSGIWAPSGIDMIKGSDICEELLILHNVDLALEVKAERKDFCYIDDFRDIYRKLERLNTRQ